MSDNYDMVNCTEALVMEMVMRKMEMEMLVVMVMVMVLLVTNECRTCV